MTQVELARVVDMPQPSIARIERGTVLPRTATLLAILAATGHEWAVEPAGPVVDRKQIAERLRLTVPERTWRALGSASKDRRRSPTAILRRLRRFNVPFVLIGELAEAAHGSPIIVGRPLEVCVAPTDDAGGRLATALEGLEPDHLHVATKTVAGDDYDVLMRTATRVLVDTSLLVRVASLDDLIRNRRAGSSPDDALAMAQLRAVGESVQP
jgi:transcriptional regulator with XRE-family HTH domain